MDQVSLAQILSRAERSVADRTFLHILTVNALMLLDTEHDAELATVFQSPDSLAVADSIGVTLAAGLRGFRVRRIPGIDLLTALCAQARGNSWSVYLLGGKPGVAERAGARLSERYPGLKICGAAHGYFDSEQERRILGQIAREKPQLVFAALAMPAQEKWIARRLRGQAGMVAMGVGGSFDVLAGDLRRAPAVFQKAGMEWLYRLGQEPWRWKRMLRLPAFLLKTLAWR